MLPLFLLFSFVSLSSALTTVLDNTDPRIQFSPGWNKTDDHFVGGDVNKWSNYSNGSEHTTTTPGAYVTVVFRGTGISWYGDVDYDNAVPKISFDGSVTRPTTAFAGSFQSQKELWSMSGRENKEHTLIITHDDIEGRWLTVDHFIYTEDDESPRRLSPTTLAGIIGGSVLLVILVVILFLYLRRRRRRLSRNSNNSVDVLYSPVDNQYALSNGLIATPWTPVTPAMKTPSTSATQYGVGADGHLMPEHSSEPPPDYTPYNTSASSSVPSASGSTAPGSVVSPVSLYNAGNRKSGLH